MLKNYNKEKQKMLDKYESQKTPKSGTKKLNMMEKYELQKNRMLTKYEIEKNIMIADWISQKADILKRWGDFKNSTKKEFVNYSDDLNSRSSVNYDEGYVEVETLVEENETKEQAIEKLKKHIEKIIKSEDASGKPIVKDQIDFDKKIEPVEKKVKPIKKVEDEVEDIKKLKVEKVDDKKIEKFVSENVTENNVKIEKVKSEDKKVKQKVTVKIPLKDKHTLIRAKKYYDLTKKYSKKYGLDPEYTLAVMETESYFNPYARSPIPAYGLMQLVPATGAYDASKLVFGEHKKLEGKLLYNPELNINLGAAYFDLIFNRYLKKYKHLKFKYLVACTAAYNCGPTRISRFMKKKDYSKYSDRDFYIEIKNNIPEETQNYIDKVLKRTNKYYKYNLDTLE
jgi:membrane-bound lytic murein transglycosylase C